VSGPLFGTVAQSHPRASANLFWDMFAVYARQSPKLREQWASSAEEWGEAQACDKRPWPERQAAGATSWPSQDELEEALSQAGFVDIQFVTEEAEIVAADEDEWWTWQWSHMPRASMEQLEPDLLERFKADAFQKLRSLREPDGIHEWSGATLAFGIKSAG